VTERWTDLNGQFVARQFLLAMAVMASVTVLLLVKHLICVERQKRLSERERLRQSSVSEMREKKLNRQLAQASFLADKNARLTERENISRNIHNSVGHNITAAIMTLDAADMLYDVKPEEARKRMNDANERIRGSLESIRRAVRTLDAETKMLPVADLKAAMESIINEFVMDTERHVEIIYDLPEIVGNTTEPPAVTTSNSSSGATAVTGSAGETASVNTSAGREDTTDGLTTATLQIPHEHAEFLTGVLQEMLTNGVKHGNATEFVVILSGDSAHIRLESKDNGRSDFTAENSGARIEKGFGVKKIISYAERCGGHTEFHKEEGFCSVIELPI
jgi:signal transduction histidine kinase